MYAPVGAGRSSSAARRLAAVWWRLFFAMLLVVAAPMARAETTLTATFDSATCIVFTPPGLPHPSRAVPCDASGVSVDLAPGEVLQVHVSFSYMYRDDGLTFASGAATVLCDGAPCNRYPGVSGSEFGVLYMGVLRADCACTRTYGASLRYTDGPDVISGVDGFFEFSSYGTLTPTSVNWEFFSNTVTVSAATPVPEPATWLLMALALPLMAGSSLHRRSRSA